MWRVVVRLTCIVMGGVLVVMTLGIGVRRDDPVPRLLVLTPRWHDLPVIIYYPERKWRKIQYLDSNYGYLHFGGQDWFTYLGTGGYLYRQTLFDAKPTRFTRHSVSFLPALSPGQQWLVYRNGSEDGETRGLYALRVDGSAEYHLTQDVPDYFDEFGYVSFSPDGRRIAFLATSTTRLPSAVYSVRLNGTDLQVVLPEINQIIRGVYWLPGDMGLIVNIEAVLYRVNLMTGITTQVLHNDFRGNLWLLGWLPASQSYLVVDRGLGESRFAGIQVDGTVAWSYSAKQVEYSNTTPQQSYPAGQVEYSNTTPQMLLQPAPYPSGYFKIVDTATGRISQLAVELRAQSYYQYSWSPKGDWVVFNAIDNQTGQEALWRITAKTHQLTRLWGPNGADIFDHWVSPDGQEILVDAATPTWAGLLRMNPDGSDVRELTSVQDIELGEHDFVDWATFPDRAWQPVALGGGGIGLVVIGFGWPIVSKFVSRRRHLA